MMGGLSIKVSLCRARGEERTRVVSRVRRPLTHGENEEGAQVKRGMNFRLQIFKSLLEGVKRNV